jgi:putative transposon-encoded protein
MKTPPIEVKISGYETCEKTVKARGNSGYVYLPVSWVGKRVFVTLLEGDVDE